MDKIAVYIYATGMYIIRSNNGALVVLKSVKSLSVFDIIVNKCKSMFVFLSLIALSTQSNI